MPNTTVYTNNQYYQDIAAAIRNKNGQSTLYKPSEMAPAINALVVSGGAINLQNKTVSPSTSQIAVSADSGYMGLGTVTVNAMPSGTAGTPTATKGTVSNNSILIVPSVTNTTGYITGSTKTGTAVTVTASELVSGNKSITANGTNIDVTNYATVSVNVASGGTTINNQNKTVTPTESQQSISADTGYTGLGTVTVEAISSTYVGSGIARKSSSDLTVSGAIVSVPAGYYSAAASKSVASGTAGTPTATKGTVSSNSITVTPSVTNTTGYITGGTKTGTAVTISASELVSGNKSITSNGTGIDVTNYATVSVSVPTGSTIKNQDKTVTPTKSQQSVTFDVDSNNYTGLGTVTVNAIPAQYITTTDANATAANILYNKTAYVNGSKITGSMANNGATGGTITIQGGTYTIPAGYTSGGTVTANLTAGSLTNSIINGAATLEDTNDYAFGVTVNIPAGYYNATELTKSFSSILPAPTTEGTAPELLAGYDLYNHLGQVITGSMTNNGAWNRTLDQTTTSVTIPAGYHNGTGTVSHTTVNIPDPTISVSSAGLITASGSWTRGFTTDNSYSKTSQLLVQAATTATPTESEQTIVTSGKYTTGAIKVAAIPADYVGSGITSRSSTDLTVSGATVTAPAGYYASDASKSVATMTLPTAATSSATSGYTSKATINRSTSDQYINIPTGYNSAGGYYKISAVANGSVTAPSSISGTTATVSTGTNTITLTKTVSVTPNVTTAGYISSGTAGNSNVSLTASVAIDPTPTVNGMTVSIPAGYYTSQTQKSVSSGSATGPSSLSGSNATITTGTNTITLTKTGVTTTPTVSAGYVSSATASTATVALTASVTTKAAATITPGTSNQTIASGTYLTGTQTIAGDADLIAANIKTGVNIFNVAGTFTADATAAAADIVEDETAYVNGTKVTGTLIINRFYTGSTAPSASLGNNGDIYLQE